MHRERRKRRRHNRHSGDKNTQINERLSGRRHLKIRSNKKHLLDNPFVLFFIVSLFFTLSIPLLPRILFDLLPSFLQSEIFSHVLSSAQHGSVMLSLQCFDPSHKIHTPMAFLPSFKRNVLAADAYVAPSVVTAHPFVLPVIDHMFCASALIPPQLSLSV